jgi:hypothetical protein
MTSQVTLAIPCDEIQMLLTEYSQTASKGKANTNMKDTSIPNLLCTGFRTQELRDHDCEVPDFFQGMHY